MATYADLSPYVYDDETPEPMLNVGWLGVELPFPRGEVPREVREALVELADRAQNPYRGYHYCEFCREESPIKVDSPTARRGYVSLGNGEIRVRGSDGTLYAAPTLIIHYIDKHGYAPPAQFCAAVLANRP